MNPINTIQSREAFHTLVTVQDIKTYIPIAANIVNASLIPHIITATDTVLRPILGSTLYSRLLDEWTLANFNPNDLRDGTQTPDMIDYKELYKQLFFPLIWNSALQALPFLAVKISEKGIMLNDSDYSDNAGIVGLNEMKFTVRKTAENYTEQLICYVKDTFKSEDFANESKAEGGFFSGIHFPIKPSKCKNC